MYKFKCEKCGSSNLAYQKFIKCITNIQFLEDGTIYYSTSLTNEEDSLGVNYGFCCARCETMLYHRGEPLQTEGDLLYYLSLSDEDRQRQNGEYFDLIQSELDYEDEQKQEFDELISQNTED